MLLLPRVVGSAHNSIIVWREQYHFHRRNRPQHYDYKIRLGVADSIPIGIECVVVLTGLTNPNSLFSKKFQSFKKHIKYIFV